MSSPLGSRPRSDRSLRAAIGVRVRGCAGASLLQAGAHPVRASPAPVTEVERQAQLLSNTVPGRPPNKYAQVHPGLIYLVADGLERFIRSR
jgi:hypothetical protein